MHRHLWLLVLTLLCTCRASTPPPAAQLAETPLPDMFGPIDWSTDADSLRARFPEARVWETDHDPRDWKDEEGRELVAVEVVATDAHLEPFGTVDIRVMRFEGHAPAVLVIQRSDNPDECFPGGASQEQSDACLLRLESARRAVYDSLAARLTSRFGPGKLDHLQSEAMLTDKEPVDIAQSERTWELPGLVLRLALGMDPRYHSPMMVRLVASRDPRYPY
ncbi:hypothetical protein [Cystobacter fuscus]|uniref:hypothetical protein n=1 Tax=Cystobacter fuscus TaxID=43 RepID=UPI002B2D77BE|nr:hypothetical protein F0U63_41040 [Cystobacter fuscus]